MKIHEIEIRDIIIALKRCKSGDDEGKIYSDEGDGLTPGYGVGTTREVVIWYNNRLQEIADTYVDDPDSFEDGLSFGKKCKEMTRVSAYCEYSNDDVGQSLTYYFKGTKKATFTKIVDHLTKKIKSLHKIDRGIHKEET